jgi:urocanate hydratase
MVETLSLFNLMMSVCLIIGGYIAYRYGFTRTVNEMQERVIHALQSEVQSMQSRISALEHENKHLNRTIMTICSALMQRGIQVDIDGDTLSIHDIASNGLPYNTHVYGIDDMSLQDQMTQLQSQSATQPKARKRGKRHSSCGSPEEEH